MRDTAIHRKLIHDQLEYCESTAHAYHDEEIELRCARALIAFDAPVDIDIFSDEFIKNYFHSILEDNTLDK